ncbi:MAG: hypothetical protein U0414_12920 [Polyangiaceae bacterium]
MRLLYWLSYITGLAALAVEAILLWRILTNHAGVLAMFDTEGIFLLFAAVSQVLPMTGLLVMAGFQEGSRKPTAPKIVVWLLWFSVSLAALYAGVRAARL